MPTDDYRLGFHSSRWRASRRDNVVSARPSCWRRAQWPGYSPARSGLSTPVVNKSSHGPKRISKGQETLIFRASRRTRATILRRSGRHIGVLRKNIPGSFRVLAELLPSISPDCAVGPNHGRVGYEPDWFFHTTEAAALTSASIVDRSARQHGGGVFVGFLESPGFAWVSRDLLRVAL